MTPHQDFVTTLEIARPIPPRERLVIEGMHRAEDLPRELLEYTDLRVGSVHLSEQGRWSLQALVLHRLWWERDGETSEGMPRSGGLPADLLCEPTKIDPWQVPHGARVFAEVSNSCAALMHPRVHLSGVLARPPQVHERLAQLGVRALGGVSGRGSPPSYWRERFTCHGCPAERSCHSAYDPYNTDGDCIEAK